MTEGECAGTRAFVKQSKRRATLRALGDATVYTLTPEDFEELLDANPRLAYMVMRALFRITHTNLARVNQESQELTNYITKTHGRY
jgi:CRP/FNR family transcriptional regulator, cyclic AMP receptor protein